MPVYTTHEPRPTNPRSSLRLQRRAESHQLASLRLEANSSISRVRSGSFPCLPWYRARYRLSTPTTARSPVMSEGNAIGVNYVDCSSLGLGVTDIWTGSADSCSQASATRPSSKLTTCLFVAIQLPRRRLRAKFWESLPGSRPRNEECHCRSHWVYWRDV